MPSHTIKWLLVITAPTNCAVQKVVPASLRTRKSNCIYYLVHGNQAGEYRSYDSLRWEFYWPRMASDVYTVVSDHTECSRAGTKLNQRTSLDLFSPAGTFQFVSIDSSELLLTPNTGNYLILFVTNRYTEVPRVVRQKRYCQQRSPTSSSMTGYFLTEPQKVITLIVFSNLLTTSSQLYAVSSLRLN